MKGMAQQMTFADESPEYKAFVEKFKPKKTTDDCGTRGGGACGGTRGGGAYVGDCLGAFATREGDAAAPRRKGVRMKRRTHSNGVYFDRSTKGEVGKQHHSYRAEVVEDGRRIRRRFCTYEAAQEWIAKMCECGGAE